MVALHLSMYEETGHDISCYLCCNNQRHACDLLQRDPSTTCTAENFSSYYLYCYGEGFGKVLMQDYELLHGVIAFVRSHYHAWWRLPAVTKSNHSDVIQYEFCCVRPLSPHTLSSAPIWRENFDKSFAEAILYCEIKQDHNDFDTLNEDIKTKSCT